MQRQIKLSREKGLAEPADAWTCLDRGNFRRLPDGAIALIAGLVPLAPWPLFIVRSLTRAANRPLLKTGCLVDAAILRCKHRANELLRRDLPGVSNWGKTLALHL